MNRRKFLDALAVTAAGFAALPSSNGPYSSRYQTGKIRNEAGLLREEFSFPEGYVYLNTGGIGSVPRFVRELVSSEWTRLEQAPSPGHDMVFWSDLKKETASFLGTGISPSEIAFTGCATEGINIILNGIEFKKGDEIITSAHEHPALNIPLLNLSARKGIKIKTFEPDIHSGLNNVKRVTDLIGKRTKLIFVSHRTATTGQILPVREIGAAVAGRNILFAIDGAQVPGSMPVGLSDLNAGFYTFSCHKWMLAPRRTGVLWVKEKNFDILNPSVTGAYSDSSHSLTERRIELHFTAQRYEYGTQNDLLFRGMQASMRFLAAAGINTVRENNEALSENFYRQLESVPSVTVHSPSEREYRSSMISFSVNGKPASEVASAFAAKNIRVRQVTEAALNAIRVSFHLYNDQNDLDRITGVLKDLVKKI